MNKDNKNNYFINLMDGIAKTHLKSINNLKEEAKKLDEIVEKQEKALDQKRYKISGEFELYLQSYSEENKKFSKGDRFKYEGQVVEIGTINTVMLDSTGDKVITHYDSLRNIANGKDAKLYKDSFLTLKYNFYKVNAKGKGTSDYYSSALEEKLLHLLETGEVVKLNSDAKGMANSISIKSIEVIDPTTILLTSSHKKSRLFLVKLGGDIPSRDQNSIRTIQERESAMRLYQCSTVQYKRYAYSRDWDDLFSYSVNVALVTELEDEEELVQHLL